MRAETTDMYLNFNPQPMCVVRRRKLNGPGDHYGLVLPTGAFVDLNPDGVRIKSAEEFAQGRDVDTVRMVAPSKYALVKHRLQSVSTSPPTYKLVGMNCEDFANWLSGESAISGQVLAVGIAAVVVALATA